MRYGTLLALAVALAACSTGIRTSSLPKQSALYSPEEVTYATRDGHLATVIHGNPFDIPKAASDDAVIASLRLPGGFPDTEFIPRPPQRKPTGHRLVLVFNPVPPGAPTAAMPAAISATYRWPPTRHRPGSPPLSA